MNLIKKYAPKDISQIIGQDFSIQQLKNFIQNFKKQKKKSVLIYGPPGSGKTISIYAIANELNYEVLEVNASDQRNAQNIELIIKPSLQQKSLFSQGKIILIDEIDAVSGNQDRGGIQTILKLIESTKFPIIFTSNDPYSQKLNSLRKKAVLIEFKPLNSEIIFKFLKNIAKKENLKLNEEILKKIASSSKGDLRAAVNDLESIADKKDLTEKDLVIGERNKKETIFYVLNSILKEKDINKSLNAFGNTDIGLDDGFLWIDENLPYWYHGKDLVNAYDALSKADVFRGRILRWQHYRFLIYENALMTSGISLAKKNLPNQFNEYKRPSRILKIWIANMKYKKQKSIAKKIAIKTHTSIKKTIKDTMPYIKILFKNTNPKEIVNYLKLEDEEIEWLRK